MAQANISALEGAPPKGSAGEIASGCDQFGAQAAQF
jgi:hypothetical protein